MNALFKKLNYRNQKTVYILNMPSSFSKESDEMASIAEVKTRLGSAKEVEFLIAFVTRQNEVDELAHSVVPRLGNDAVLWFAYPKGSSKKYKCEFNRDNGWQELGKLGLEPVRMVAIDEDWSGLRFRNAEKIKTMTRSFAMSDTGKKKVAEAAAKKKPK
jgi:hypothetical protein